MFGCRCLVILLSGCLVVLLSGCFVVCLFCCLLVDSFGWKPIPSEARVTRDEVAGIKKVRESCLPDSLSLLVYNPETSSQVTLASLGTVFQTWLAYSVNSWSLSPLSIFFEHGLYGLNGCSCLSAMF